MSKNELLYFGNEGKTEFVAGITPVAGDTTIFTTAADGCKLLMLKILAVSGAVTTATVKINTKTYNIKVGAPLVVGDSLLHAAPIDGNTNPYVNIAGGYVVSVAIIAGNSIDVVAYMEDY